jgi:uncharacterized paraquat-inducible protein A
MGVVCSNGLMGQLQRRPDTSATQQSGIGLTMVTCGECGVPVTLIGATASAEVLCERCSRAKRSVDSTDAGGGASGDGGA